MTELFGARAADPEYEELLDTDVEAVLNDNQSIELIASSATRQPETSLEGNRPHPSCVQADDGGKRHELSDPGS